MGDNFYIPQSSGGITSVNGDTGPAITGVITTGGNTFGSTIIIGSADSQQVNFVYAGNTKMSLTTSGVLINSPIYYGTLATANASLTQGTTGTIIGRNQNDANTVLTVAQTHASATGDIAQFTSGGTLRAKIRSTGLIETAAGLINTVSSNQAVINPSATGTQISRNIADANPALLTTQSHASSTGDIQQWANSTGTIATMSQSGSLTIPGTMVSQAAKTQIIQITNVNNAFTNLLYAPGTTANRQTTFPDATGTVVLNDNTATLTNKSIVATQLTGTVPTAVLGSGTADSSTYLRGDNTWVILPSIIKTTAITLNNTVVAYTLPIANCEITVEWKVIRVSDSRLGRGVVSASSFSTNFVNSSNIIAPTGSGAGIYTPTCTVTESGGTISVSVADTDASSNKNWQLIITIKYN